MTSIIQMHAIKVDGINHLITVTAQSTNNDINGTPYYLFQVWTNAHNGIVWYPKIDGLKSRKDNTYKIQCFDLPTRMKRFVEQFEESLNSN